MKKLLFATMILAMLLCLCACGDYVSLMPGAEVNGLVEEEFSADTLGDFLHWEDFMADYYNNTPVALSYCGEEGYASPVFDRESIIKACDALRSTRVDEEVGYAPEGTSADSVFCFTMADGNAYTLSFYGDKLFYEGTLYALSGCEALWDIAFPGYGGDFDMFDLYYNSKVSDFADGFTVENAVSVGRRNNGGAVLSNQDSEVIGQVFALMAEASIESVEMNPDQNIDLNVVQDYVFTMSDGSSQTFTFTGGCLTVTVSEDYGPVYYHLSCDDALAELSIAASTGETVFEGGYLRDLRSDIERAVKAANGEYVLTEEEMGQATRITETDSEESSESTESTTLSVAGVYVSFDINGVNDYISVTGDEATALVQQMGQMEVTSEKLETEPEGGMITASVNLSDWSGPLCYFCDGAVQQTVGNWYRCEESGYEALVNRIMEIYEVQLTTRDEIGGTESESGEG